MSDRGTCLGEWPLNVLDLFPVELQERHGPVLAFCLPENQILKISLSPSASGHSPVPDPSIPRKGLDAAP